MNDVPVDPPDSKADIPALSRQLQDLNRRLQALIPPDIDAVIGAGGESLLLQQAQQHLLRSEREQRSLAQQLSRERERLIAAQTVAKIGSWSIDFVSGDREWSDETYKIFEKDPARFALTDETILQLVHPSDRDNLVAVREQSIRTGGAVVLEHKLKLPGAGTKFVEQRWQVERDGKGVATRAFGTCQDITERRQTEEVLRRNQAQLTMASRVGHIGAWTLSLAPLALSWSDEVYAIHDSAPGQGIEFGTGH
ncbi:MAG: PAS domain-containing protein [Steroidobacteraceae bacterium]